MKMFLSVVGLCFMLLSVVPEVSAEVKLPTYASGNASTEAQNVGKKITDFLSLAVGILAIIAMLAGAGFLPFNRDRAWQLIGGGVVALVVAGLVFGIAKLVA